jgi:hypothetical protein
VKPEEWGGVSILVALATALVKGGPKLWSMIFGVQKERQRQDDSIFARQERYSLRIEERLSCLEKESAACDKDRALLWRVVRENGLVPVGLSNLESEEKNHA